MKKKIIGLVEDVIIFGNNNKEKTFPGRIDTGAEKSSIDTKIASELNLGPVLRTKKIKSAHGTTLRPIVEVEVELAGEKMKALFSVVDRSHMKYPVLIGQNILTNGFLIDPSKK
ncbi:ATP-dependent zinc protease [Candidatus Woesearchaeota archaeon]|nr:ATP-dependent zinc protease [Candidatus Woesearchaeota archaeon]